MFRLPVVALLFTVALSTPLVTREWDDQWENFKRTYNKQYGADEHIRRLIWEDNLKFIQKHNLEAANGLHTFTLGENEYSDLTNREFTATMNGFVMEKETSDSEMVRFDIDLSDLPDSVDWRTKGYVTEVKTQGMCGSCYAFSATGSLEGQTFKKTGKLISLSEQNIVDCSDKQGNKGCGGGFMNNAFKYIKINNGIDTEKAYPYIGYDPKEPCLFNRSGVGATDTGYRDIWKYSEKELQKAVATVGPISVAIDANGKTFQHYKNGIYVNKNCSTKYLDHGVLAVGYGTDNNLDYWIVKNSWGKKWGMKGYIKMARNHRNMCGIATKASYPTV